MEVDSVPVQEIRSSTSSESSAQVAERVLKARKIQQKRYQKTNIHSNAQLDNAGIRQFCSLDSAAEQILNLAVERMHLSMRAYHRVIKVARTIADLQCKEIISATDIAEAVQYRELDQKYWK